MALAFVVLVFFLQKMTCMVKITLSFNDFHFIFRAIIWSANICKHFF